MSKQDDSHRKIPPDIVQIPIVWSYELLKYFRSWRIVASIAIVIAILGLIYILPPALGSPYSGTDEKVAIWVEDVSELNLTFPGMMAQSFGSINRSVIDTDTLQMFLNGTLYPSKNSSSNEMNWIFMKLEFADELPSFMGGTPTLNAVIFMQNVTGGEITASYKWTTSEEDFESVFLSFASILIIICATFFASDALVGEFQNRTGYLVFPNPIKREVLFLGKFAASMTAGILVVVLFYAGVAMLSYLTVRGVDDDFVASGLFAVEFLLAATAVAYVISAVLKGTTGATVLTFLLFMIILPILDGISSFTGAKMDGSLTFASGVIGYVVMDPYPVDTSVEAFGITIYSFYPAPATAALVMLAYTIIGIVISMFLFKRKQLAG